MLEWVVLYVRTGCELEIARKCGTTLVPRERTGKPYLPGYVFLHWEPSAERYYAIRRVNGVLRFLGTDKPEPVPTEQMDVMLALDRQGRSPPAPAATVNGKTILIGGAMAAVPHKVIGVNRRAGRATIAVQLLGETHAVHIAIDKQPTKDGE